MQFFVRTTGDRILDSSYSQINYSLLVDEEKSPIDHFIKCLYKINDNGGVILEDDLILCDDFERKIEKAIAQYPNRIINFFQAPHVYRDIEEMYDIWYNQCTYYPEGITKQIADIIKTLPRKEGISKNQYSLLESEALRQLDIKVVQYRPHLVQHLDKDTLLFPKTWNARRSYYFLNYLNKLGITYKEAHLRENRTKLIKIMKEDFAERNL